jgi:HK97 family phage prohead protease
VKQYEQKTFSVALESVDDGSFSGSLAVYNTADSYNDIIVPGAATKSMERQGWALKMLYQHDARLPIGLLNMRDTPDALRVDSARFNLKKQLGQDAYSDVQFYQQNNHPLGLSIGFYIHEPGDIEVDRKSGIRYLKQIDIIEGSIVTFPAHDRARIDGVKSILAEIAASIKSIRDYEDFLRDAGFSRKEAAALASGGWKAINQRDADTPDVAALQALFELRNAEIRRLKWN